MINTESQTIHLQYIKMAARPVAISIWLSHHCGGWMAAAFETQSCCSAKVSFPASPWIIDGKETRACHASVKAALKEQ